MSTGMPGHPTPQGVFSVIEKDRYHHSNIYSGAPMPFMQRITWGGVAMHAGVLPGYPASHGCIRMPKDFATKMWGWTKMGARVFVTPGEVPAPAAFSHPFLAAYKVAPQPVVAEPPADPDAKVGAEGRSGRARDQVDRDQARSAAVGRTRQACRCSHNAHRRRRAKTAVTMTDAGGAAPRTKKPIETADAAGTVPAKSERPPAKRSRMLPTPTTAPTNTDAASRRPKPADQRSLPRPSASTPNRSDSQQSPRGESR